MTSPRRAVLLAAAAELFSRQGYHSVGIDEIGAAGGVTGPAVYRHFQSKDAILQELCDTAMSELLAGARRARGAKSPGDVLKELVAVHAGFGARHRRLLAVYVREHRSLSPTALRALRRRQRAYETIWADALTRVRHDLDPMQVSGLVTAVLSLLNSAGLMPAGLDDSGVEAILVGAAGRTLQAALPDAWDLDAATG